MADIPTNEWADIPKEWKEKMKDFSCHRCGGKASRAYIQSPPGEMPTPENSLILAIVCEGCEKKYNAEILDLLNSIRKAVGLEESEVARGTIH